MTLTSVAQELSESEGKRHIIISAPQSGIITATTAEPGQAVDSTRPLLSIIPNNTKLRAELFASSKVIGFIKLNDKVVIRYQPFPYQHFGNAIGTIESIAAIGASSNEINSVGSLKSSQSSSSDELFYRVIVRLPGQSIQANGKRYALQSGMSLDADIMLEKRRLFQWMFEPVYAMTSKLQD